MSEFKYSDEEQQFNNILNYQADKLTSIQRPDMNVAEERILKSETLLRSLGYSLEDIPKVLKEGNKPVIVVPAWEDLCVQAEQSVGSTTDLESLFTQEELQTNELAIKLLNEEFNAVHRLDKCDIAISAIAGILGAVVDILLVGIPEKTSDGMKAGALSNYIRGWFDNKYPAEEMEKLAGLKVGKVPYDAQDNRNITKFVDGLSSYYHRLLSLGHDPFLGLIFGVLDIMTGRMTTIDKTGKIASQVMENYVDRKETNIFAAIAKQIIHLKSDITTSMGLPAPLMGLFNLLQFGSIGEVDQTIAEIVQGMYYEGYDFIHFCSMSIPTMIIEVGVRLGYALKRIKEGYSVKESIPFSLNKDRRPKLNTMLFISHSIATAVNAGKVYFTKNPMAINEPQWLAFAKYSYKQLKWALVDKPELRDAYVRGAILEELSAVYEGIDAICREYEEKYIVIFN